MAPSGFDEELYLELNPDIARAVQTGAFRSGFHHWVACGRAEGRPIRRLTPAVAEPFDEVEYLYANPDVEQAVRLGTISSGAQHWIEHGSQQDRFLRSDQRYASPPNCPPDWDEHVYLIRNPDVAHAVRAGLFESGWDHWITFGIRERRYCGDSPARFSPRPEPFPTGINYIGLLSARSGLGTASQGHLDVLRRAGIPVAVNDIQPASLQPGASGSPKPLHVPHSLNLINLTPDLLQLLWCNTGTFFMKGRYNIAMWVWELPVGYPHWNRISASLDEIWAPSTFAANSLSTVVRPPVKRVPIVVDHLPENNLPTRTDLGIPLDKFVYLYVFDVASTLERKNPFALLRAFSQTFAGRDDALLVLKYHRSEGDEPRGVAVLEQMAHARPNILTIDRFLSLEETCALYRHCDCYVSPHRSEGFGLTLASAMYYQKPVIATGYSGNMDFTNNSNSYLIDYDLVTVPPGVPHYRAGYVWAEPFVEHLSALLRHVFDNREDALQRAQNGKRTVTSAFSTETVTQTMAACLPAAVRGVLRRGGDAGVAG